MITAKLILLGLLNTNMFDLPNTVDVEQVYCLALNLYHESRGESMQGQIGTAFVVMTRVADHRFPNSVCEVVMSSKVSENNMPMINQCQFSWYCDGKNDRIKFTVNGKLYQPNIDAFRQVAAVALLTIGGVIGDNTNGSTHYYNHNTVNPAWAKYYTKTAVIGRHTFVRREKGSLI